MLAANTLPLWRQQLAQAVTIHRSREAAEVIRFAGHLTNELLKANAENLKQGNAEAGARLNAASSISKQSSRRMPHSSRLLRKA